jgi:hypothetical protein
MTLFHGASALGRMRRRFLALITALTLVAPLLLVGAMPVAASVDPLILANSTITAEASTATAGDSVTITLQLNDGTSDVDPGGVVTLTSDQVGDLTVTYNGGGNYTAELVDTTARLDTVTGTLDGEAFADNATVDFTPGPASRYHTTFTAEAPVTVDDPTADITVLLADQYDNPTDLLPSESELVLSVGESDPATVTQPSSTATVGTWVGSVSLADNGGTSEVDEQHTPVQITVTGTIGGEAIVDSEDTPISAVADFLPGALASFAVVADDDPAIVAGTAFDVTATAKDQWGNVKTNYEGGATVGDSIATGLSTSPACTSCASGGSAPSYGAFGTWTAGVATASVTAYAAETGRTVTVADGTPSGVSNGFGVGVSSATNVDFADSAVSFNGQPITTKKGTHIYSVCDPSGSPTTPCLAAPSSTPVQVLVRDAYGNPIESEGVTLAAVTSGFTVTGSGTTGADGKVAFDPISATPSTKTGGLVLKATLDSNATVTNNSQSFEIVDDLTACDGQSCSSNSTHTVGVLAPTLSPTRGKPSSPVTQRAYARISTDEDFFDLDAEANVLLTTRWIAPTEVNNKCGSNSSLGDAVDIQAQGGLAETTPSTQMVLVLPAKTLQALGISSRGTPSFNVCLGALDLSGTADPWQQKQVIKKVVSLTDSSFDGTRYWGIPADCGFVGLAADDPCIGLRTKQASVAQAYLGLNSTDFAALGIKDSDLVIVIQKPYPWDAKGSIF